MTQVSSEVDALSAAIRREALATERALDTDGLEAEGRELLRQLSSLRGRVAGAPVAPANLGELRAELATLLFFAKTLRADAEAWRAGLRQKLAQVERQEAAARRQRERQAAEKAEVLRRRIALQSMIDEEAARIAQRKHGEWRRTLPVITLHPGLTVSSMTVSSARRRFRSVKLWLVTLDEARRDVLVRPGC